MSLFKSAATTAFKLAYTVTDKAFQIAAPFTPEYIKTKVVMASKLAEQVYEKPYDKTKELVPPAIFDAGEKIAISVYQNTLKAAAISSRQAKNAYSITTEKAGDAYNVASVKGKELVIYSSAQAKKAAAFSSVKAGELYSFSVVKAKEATALTARVSSKAAADLQKFLIAFSKYLSAQLAYSANLASLALSVSSSKVGAAYLIASVKGKQIASYTYSESKVAASVAYVKLSEFYAYSSVKAKNALDYSVVVGKKTATDLQVFIVYFAKLLMAQVDKSLMLAGQTASSVASFAALEGSKLYSNGLVYLKVKTA